MVCPQTIDDDEDDVRRLPAMTGVLTESDYRENGEKKPA
jgi:hypothetical protein